MSIFWGFILAAIGASITIYSEKILNMFGSIDFFEGFLRTEGGSRLAYKLIGIFTFFIGVLIMTGMIEGFLSWVLSPLIRTQI